MKRFVVPPSWPSPPRRSWVPPKTWRPDPSWPPVPDGWRFWVDGKGKPVRGPIGQYAAPSRRVVYAGAGALILFLGVNLWALSAIGLFGGKSDDTASVVTGDQSPSPSVSPTVTPTATPVVPRTTVTPPLVPKTVVPTKQATRRPTQEPTRAPSSTRTTERTQTPDPKPTRTTTSTKPTTPRPTVQPSTREEILRQYCIDRGWDPSLCDPKRWETPQHP
ncbi:hypothetical protein [Kribbella kalugense]|uniref:Uncharacterized protein n=1 Tax=Kribbella kalugense TaxID=2512221 RepID=A0A4R7ZQG0_9ACTN|nr:hypothetical protein [Kribbella kalugense]TDW19021.1 hypothetical protein EV650_5624 [Kribbella kalugense]